MENDPYRIASEVTSLPSPPGIASHVLEVLSAKVPDLKALQRVIECDPVLVARVLRAANSPDRTTRRPISTVLQAIRTLGAQEIHSVLLSFELPSWKGAGSPGRFDPRLHWRHSLTTAIAARDLIGNEPTLRDEAYAAGILQDIGVLALNQIAPDRYDSVLSRLNEMGEELWLSERAEIGTDHMEVGAELLRNWRIPPILWEPISVHHQASGTALGDPIEARIARVLRVAAQVGKVFCLSEDASALVRLRELALDLLGIGGPELEEILQRVEPQMQSAVEELDLDLGEQRAFGDLMRRANERLAALTLDMGQNLAQAENRLETTDRAARELRVQRFAAEEANRLKSQFLANMSHEIRTPMTAIVGYLDLMADPDLTAEDHTDYISVVRRNADHLLKLLDGILDLSKLEAGHMQVERTRTSACQMVTDVASLMRARAIAKGLAFEIEYLGAIPETIETDPTRLRQILLNLAGNAIKFTDTGEVRVIVELLESVDREQPRMRFVVADTGVGISGGAQAKIFEPFMQVDMSTTREHGGTGLGLAISKRLVGLLGGDISLESEPGSGTRVSLTIEVGSLKNVRMIENPAEAIAEEVAAETVAPCHLEGSVLLADDGADNRRLISLILLKSGLRVDTTENGRIAVEKALRAESAGEPYDLILMDVQMPELDGLSATVQLRQSGYNGQIVALTAHAMSHERDACLRAGCDGFASKPIDRPALLAVVAEHIEGK